jgi:hypothetical protein
MVVNGQLQDLVTLHLGKEILAPNGYKAGQAKEQISTLCEEKGYPPMMGNYIQSIKAAGLSQT